MTSLSRESRRCKQKERREKPPRGLTIHLLCKPLNWAAEVCPLSVFNPYQQDRNAKRVSQMLSEGPNRSPTVKQMRAEEESMGGVFRTDKINRILKIAWQLDGEREIKMFKREHLCIFILYLYKMSVCWILIDLGVEFLSKRVCRFGCCLFIVKPVVVFSLSLFTFLFSSRFFLPSLWRCA